MDTPVRSEIIALGQFGFDRHGRRLFRCGEAGNESPVNIGSRALDVLAVLLERPGELVTKDEIMATVWPDTLVDGANLTVQISALRRVLDDDRVEVSCILTVPGRGYRLVGFGPRPAADLPETEVQTASPQDVVNRSTRALQGRWRVTIIGLVVFSVAIAGGAAAWMKGREWAAHPRLSIVVLPFENLGGDHSDDYLADGITDDLTSDLTHVPDAFVIARGSAYTYKGKLTDPRQIGSELGVRYAVEGSVRRVGDALRLGVQLISTESGRELWSDRFDERIADLPAGQDQILTRMRSELGISVVDIEAARGQRERPSSPDAFDLILRARALYNQPRNLSGHKEACALYERALAMEPSSVSALSWVAFCELEATWTIGSWRGFADMQRAGQLLAKAQEIAPNSEEFLYVNQLWLRSQGRCQAVIANGQQILARLPNSYWRFFNAVGTCQLATGHAEEDIRLLKQAMRRDPRDPYTAWSYRRLGWDLLLLGKEQDAIGFLEQALAMQPEDDSSKGWTYNILASAYALTGHIEEARRARAEAVRISPYLTVRCQHPDFGSSETFAGQIRHYQDGLRLAGERDHADEDADFGVSSDRVLHSNLVGLTPKDAPGVTVIRTADLSRFLEEGRPLVIDTMLNSWQRSLPGAIGLRYGGVGGSLDDAGQDRLRSKLKPLTGGDLTRPIVTVGVNSEHFDSRNLALRLAALGYTQIYWYRGGREAWEVAGLPETEISAQDW